ncbi:hypothetical protein [Limosilactobacillus gastricus]|uniref:hypothetical protein n=1 Tax=Limosilactobacillus gastricus TaxID=227942 RepID=UPI0003163C8D|nr:hypothetical protein [Limosilactobacillus gastricus]
MSGIEAVMVMVCAMLGFGLLTYQWTFYTNNYTKHPERGIIVWMFVSGLVGLILGAAMFL